MAAEEGNIVRGIHTGAEVPADEVEDEDGNVWPIILPRVTHLTVHDSITAIRSHAFHCHSNITELICHKGVGRIGRGAFNTCPRLKRLVLTGLEEVEREAFRQCEGIEHIQCEKLEIIREDAFSECFSLGNIDLPSAKVVEKYGFDSCTALRDVKFGKDLESIKELAFSNSGLKRITIPLKSGLFTSDDVFVGCKLLSEVFLLDEDKATIQETLDALLLDEWKNDMNNEIDSINKTLPNAYVGEHCYDDDECEDKGEKTKAIRDWIARVLQKIIYYKEKHYRLLSLATAALAHASPNEIVINNAISFLHLPDHVFEGEDDSRTTTLALDRQLWEDVVQMKQRLLENIVQLEQKLSEQSEEIASLRAQNDEMEDENHQLKLQIAQMTLRGAESS